METVIPISRRAAVVVLVALLAAIGIRVAGPAGGTPASGATGSILARGQAEESVKMRGRHHAYDVVVQSIELATGGHTGWHTHPGPATAIVMEGALTIYAGRDASCSPQVISAGQTYVDPGYGFVHIGRNEGTVPAKIMVTYLGVPPGGSPRIDVVDPGNCEF